MDITNMVCHGGGHVVILGAGASIASTLKDPELYGRSLPSMNSLPQVVSMEDLIEQIPEDLRSTDFEQLYSNVYSHDPESTILAQINTRIWDYFSGLKLPPKPTIYDILVMSLRPRDIIATFNWDPFLIEAYERNIMHGAKPNLSFLHGNVGVGYDEKAKEWGKINGHTASGKFFKPQPLLYPTGQKDYESNPFIRSEWELLRLFLSSDKVVNVTIFGYSAPKSDYASMKLLNDAWGGSDRRNMEQFELIDVRPEEEVVSSWDDFIHAGHYDFRTDFFQSSIAQFPRRTSEEYFCHNEPITPEEVFCEPIPVPKNFEAFDEMWAWFQPLINAEERRT